MDGPTTYSYRISSEKNLYETFFDLYDRIRQKVEVPFKVKDGLRDDDPLQLQAIREALVNLIMHTDYFSPSNARIRMFTDRFEFFNPGSLPKDIKDIIEEDFSYTGNPTIAKIFRFIRLSENIGNGFYKMITGWKSYYKIEPEIKGSFDWYKITFPTKIRTTQKTTQKIIALIKSNPSITRKELATRIGDITEDGIKYHLSKMKKDGKIKRVGPAKGGHWEIINND